MSQWGPKSGPFPGSSAVSSPTGDVRAIAVAASGFAVVPMLEARDAEVASRFPMLVAVAFALHVAAFAATITRAPIDIGDPAGSRDGLAVEVIDTAELDRRSRSAFPGRDPADALPAPAAPPAAPVADPVPPSPAPAPPPRAEAAQPKDAAEPAPPEMTPQAAPSDSKAQSPTPPAPKAQLKGLSETDIASLLTSPIEPGSGSRAKPAVDLSAANKSVGQAIIERQASVPRDSAAEHYIERRNRAGKARSGVADQFVLRVQHILEAAKPRVDGVGGRVIVEFVVTDQGQMSDLRLVQSSGQERLGDIVLASLKRLKLPSPPPGATLEDRTFEITYQYR